MPDEEEVINYESPWERQQREQFEANKRWADTACRIADALEHQVMSATIMNLKMAGFEPGPMPAVQHRAMCPTCNLVKGMRPSSNSQIISGAMPPGIKIN